MRELVEVMAKALVEHPEEVSVTETEKNGEIIVELRWPLPIWERSSANRAESPKPFVLL